MTDALYDLSRRLGEAARDAGDEVVLTLCREFQAAYLAGRAHEWKRLARELHAAADAFGVPFL